MKDFDIKIRNNSEIRVYGTTDDTIVIPSQVSVDTDREHVDIDILKNTNAVIGIPSYAEHVELNIEDAKLKLEDLHFEHFEIDAKGETEIDLEGTTGRIDINMAGGSALLLVPSGYSFRTKCEGKGNRIDCEVQEDPEAATVIELNGKNSTLTIRAK